jgi:cyclohexyl-isocyanide hydratase
MIARMSATRPLLVPISTLAAPWMEVSLFEPTCPENAPMALHVTFVLFPNVTQLDFTAAAQVLARIPDARVTVAAKSIEAVPTDCGFSILPASTFGNAGQADLLCVPGGFGVVDALSDGETVGFIREQAAGARYVTSVCTGAFLLGAAGLLRGKRATTHWAYTGLLPLVGAEVAPGRVVVDGGTITGGGVTAGLDFGLTVAAEVAGAEAAQSIQLALEYDPVPPFEAGSPDKAPRGVRAAMDDRYRQPVERMRSAIRSAAA